MFQINGLVIRIRIKVGGSLIRIITRIRSLKIRRKIRGIIRRKERIKITRRKEGGNRYICRYIWYILSYKYGLNKSSNIKLITIIIRS